MRTLALLLLLVASMAPASSASECSALTQNVLTSAACPSDCVLGSCVLYSPSQESCKYYNSTGGCLSQEDFVLNGTPCNMTYQCMNSLFDSSKNLWFLSLLDIKNSKNLAVAPVTEVHDLTYPTNSVTVQFSGTLTKSDRTDVKNVVVDDSFFKTPDKSLSFYVTGINLRSALAKADFTGRKWTRVAFSSANLDAVPPGLSQLTGLQMVDLSKNFITSIKDATPFKKVDTLSLQYNDLTDLTVDLPSIATLNLSGNPLGKIPDAIFGMRSLQTLSMRACQLTNVHLNESQYTFLSQLRSFDADATSINCTDGFKVETMASGVTVCIPDTTSAPEKSGGGGSSNTIIIVVVVVVGVLVVAAVAFLCMRRKRRPNPGDKVNTPTFGTTTGTYTGMTDGTDIWNDPDLMAVRIDYSAVEPIKLLSRGGFGEVWLGLYMNENVAIKRLLTEKRTVKDAMAFAAEIKIMARLDHPKIVRFIGVAWTNTLSIQAVTEFMDCGDLRSLLDSSRASTLTWANIKCQIAIDVADALVYMHTLNPKLIHRDLKSRNVLIDAHSGAKLSDFGISRNRSVEETMTAGVGTARWIAPEVIAGGHYTEFADIYSFGIVLTEIDTCKTPYHDAVNTNGAKMQDVTILQQVSAGKLQPSMTNSCPTAIVALARACMSFDPASRPSAIHIAYELRKILKEL